MHVPHRRALAPLVTVCLAALIAGCGSTQGPAASAARSATAATAGTATCATGSAPASLPGWTAAAKSGGIIPQIISSQQVCGRNRLLFGFSTIVTDSTGKQVATSVGSADRTAKVALYDLAKDPNNPAMTADATFMWAIEGKTGVYVANVTYPEAGDWGAAFTTAEAGGQAETIKVRFEVQDRGVMPGLGDHVPAVKTLTLTDAGGDPKRIATDPSPDPRFYQLSEDQAIAQHKPFVLVFATPAFCTSRVCGPTLDKIKAVAAQYPDLTFINVEPYKMQYANGSLQPVLDADGQLQPNDAANAFDLLSEPWVYVVDGNGIVTGSFETLAGPDELRAAIVAATKG